MPRLPSSLKWLVDQRARVDGEIKKIEASLKKCKKMAESLEHLKELLASVDQTISLHEIQISPENIPVIYSQERRIDLPYGAITKGILLCLRSNKGKQLRTTDITDFIIREYDSQFELTSDYLQFKLSVRKRLKTLCQRGLIKRHHPKETGFEGIWSLSDE